MEREDLNHSGYIRRKWLVLLAVGAGDNRDKGLSIKPGVRLHKGSGGRGSGQGLWDIGEKSLFNFNVLCPDCLLSKLKEVQNCFFHRTG